MICLKTGNHGLFFCLKSEVLRFLDRRLRNTKNWYDKLLPSKKCTFTSQSDQIMRKGMVFL